MSEAKVARDYDRWLTGGSLSGLLYGSLASLPGTVLVNTPAFRLHTELQIRPAQRVLDVGCGRGALLQTLAARVPFTRTPVGVDISRAMLRLGARDVQKAPHDVALIRASGTALPFADDAFDVVICGHLIKHLEDAALLELLREIRRVLTPGGIALLWEFAPTTSERLNAINRAVLTPGVGSFELRDYATLSAYALEAGYEWVGNARLRPFLFPPIPRVSLLLGKAPPGWINEGESFEDELARATAEHAAQLR
jgi:ubiquinone/menaquinone biosynthesis C-methylase UbiE